jgi:uncharacterized protein (TIGR02996 family)
MFAVSVEGMNIVAVRYAFAIDHVVVGSDPTSEIVLADVDRRHARIVEKDTKWIVVDLMSSSGTFLNGRRLKSPLVVKPGDAIGIGRYKLALSPIDVAPVADRTPTGVASPTDPVEARLLASIATGDDACREVYADWLDEHGDTQRAEFLRLQDRLAALATPDADFAQASARLRELASRIDIDWRVRVGRHVVEGCTFDVRCPKRWSALAETDQRGIRFCNGCNERVYYCVTVEQAREHAARGQCVALDTGAPRWTGDLAAPFGDHRCEACDIDVGEGLDRCPRCGERIGGYVTVGMIA